MQLSVLDVRAVSRRFGDRVAADGVSFALAAGRIACLLGPSGCGKSTVLRMIAGLDRVDAGTIAIDGREVAAPGRAVPPEDRGVGLVFQDLALFPHLTVADNVVFGLSGLSRADRRARAVALLGRFHAEALVDAWPHTLSGGEQQRVAMARAMAREPALLLLDEPFSGLDGHLRDRVRASVLADLRAAGATVLIVTHDPDEAMAVADDLILMADGRVVQTGSPEDCYRRPRSEAAARLLGEAIVLPAIIAGGVAETALGRFAAEGMADGPARALIRPEGLRIDPAGVAARVHAVRFAGAGYRIEATVEGVAISVRTIVRPPAPGSGIALALDPERACLHLVRD
ncbi:ABC transporter ATP-binding protein [Sphingomonas sp.]|uniref:ABC transporter ATP-binding protein n=1 Tax=Sphingomonas sp. TaxID=28214 RepID=UPI002DD6A0B1|nr:ABC transporter ATP-binding protein [Sphingomonas sp.]